jgi:hypothetical protein
MQLAAATTKLSPGKVGQCRRDFETEYDNINRIVEKINPELKALDIALKDVSSIMKNDIDPVLRPLTVVEKPIDDIYRSMMSIKKDLAKFKKLEKKKFKIKIDGITVIDTSVKLVLKDVVLALYTDDAAKIDTRFRGRIIGTAAHGVDFYGSIFVGCLYGDFTGDSFAVIGSSLYVFIDFRPIIINTN